jgi:APA family basic amino acid/polyamine antiporter
MATDRTADVSAAPALERSIGPIQLTLYALGSMLGAGIYGLIGKAAGQMGNAVWLSFLVAVVAALLTALSYASLGSRHPKAGGAAYVTQRAYGIPLLSFMVGLALVCSGLTSVATQSRVFAENVIKLAGLEATPVWLVALGFVLIMTGLVFRGIRESMWVNVVCTVVEAAGLLLVIAAGLSFWGSVDYFATPPQQDHTTLALLAVQGAVLTFFAFIGFEDTINVAEEVKNPQTTLPLALITATLIAAALYIAIAITAVSVVPAETLADVPSPLTAVMEGAAPDFPPVVLTLITVFAVANTALVNYITASRLMYGMANQGLLPKALARVHPTRHTPHIAILLLLAVVAPLAILGGISELASATVLLLLVVFTVVNGALIILKRRPGEQEGAFELPLLVPIGGAVVCAILIVARLASEDWHAPAIAGGLLAAIAAIYAVLRPKAIEAEV